MPREIVHAAGMLPVGIFGGGDQLEVIQGDAYYQSYICRIPRSTIELGLTGRREEWLTPTVAELSARGFTALWVVGDVTQPLPAAVVRAIHEAADDMARREIFKGYGPYVGYEFLRAEIATHDFGSRGVKIGVDEVFVSDGGKSDSANLQEIFAQDCVVALMDPVYPVYADSNVLQMLRKQAKKYEVEY